MVGQNENIDDITKKNKNNNEMEKKNEKRQSTNKHFPLDKGPANMHRWLEITSLPTVIKSLNHG